MTGSCWWVWSVRASRAVSRDSRASITESPPPRTGSHTRPTAASTGWARPSSTRGSLSKTKEERSHGAKYLLWKLHRQIVKNAYLERSSHLLECLLLLQLLVIINSSRVGKDCLGFDCWPVQAEILSPRPVSLPITHPRMMTSWTLSLRCS